LERGRVYRKPGRSPPQPGSALVVSVVWLLLGRVHHGISRRGRPRHRSLLIGLAAGIVEAEIMLGVLVEIFRGNGVAADCGLAREGDVALKNLMCVAANSDAGAVAVKRPIALRRSLLLGLEWLVSAKAPARRTRP
jgi:hypothetical protein